MIRTLIAGNWKMYKTIPEAVDFAERLKEELSTLPEGRDVAIAPTFTALHAVSGIIGGSLIKLCAQNLHEAAEGAFTGEISAAMICDAGCSHVIIGHSERRTLFGETDASVNRKMQSALAAGLKPIMCIGETLEQRECGETFSVIERQVKAGLHDLGAGDMAVVTIAYEPVWAIGTGKTATPEQAQEIHAFVRGIVTAVYGSDVAATLPIIYGGSVNPGNISAIMAQPDVNGALVGGASLDVDKFVKIVRY
ncbi:MAG: triose-phosphate isomerase [Smithellaceae bacterium]|nr:triose-phosphate isomerase [Smithellaceae bacterium]